MMSDLRKVIGAKEFKQRVINKLKLIDKNIKEDDLYFTQSMQGYYLEYKPDYPESSNGDFIVYQDLVGTISVYGNSGAMIPTIKNYDDITEFEKI